MSAEWLEFLGRLHPLLLHLPIGGLVLLLVLELWGLLPRVRSVERGTRTVLCCFVAMSAVASVASGWWLAEEFESSGSTFWWHRCSAFAFASCTVLATGAAWLGRSRTYASLLVISAGLLVPTGHFGAQMTHGADFLTEPFEDEVEPPVEASPVATDSPQIDVFSSVIAPLLNDKCERCHGARKQKGEFVTSTPQQLMTPGESGRAPIAPGDPAGSEVVRRLRLDRDHDDHMPPPSKPQPSEAEIAAIEGWIAAGADFGVAATASPDTASPDTASPDTASPDTEPLKLLSTQVQASSPVVMPPPGPIAALVAANVHVECIDPARQLLWVDFRARPNTTSAEARQLLEPVRQFIVDLTLARTGVDDELLPLISRMTNLERLDLSGTACTGRGLRALTGHAALRSLNLTGTRVDDADALEALPALERVFLWDSGLLPASIQALAERAPELIIEAGLDSKTPPLEMEPPVRMAKAPHLVAGNSVCPVSGKPVDPAFRIVHRGQVIAFCCGDCVAKFWSAPDQYPVK